MYFMGILSVLLSGDMIQIVLYFLTMSILILSVLPMHECAHALMAKILGDDTAERAGRLTLNPMSHLNVTGTLCMLLIGFGWANPVPVNPVRFKNQRRRQGYIALVAFAGPLSNLLMSFFWLIVYRTLFCFNMSDAAYDCISYVLPMLIFINVGLAVFNMLPIGQLDGGRIFNWIIPDKIMYNIQNSLRKLTASIPPVLYVVIFIVFINVISGPLSRVEYWLVNTMFGGINKVFDALGIGLAENYIRYLGY